MVTEFDIALLARRTNEDTLVLAWMALAAASLVAVIGLALAWWGRKGDKVIK